MDTNNTEYQQALMESYAAVLKVLRLSGSSIYTDEGRNKELIANMIAIMNSCGYQKTPQGDCPKNVEINQLQAMASTNSCGASVSPQTVTSKPVTKNVIGKRYAIKAEQDDNEYLFRRTKDRLEEGDNNRYFVLTVYDDGTGTFEMADDIVGEKFQILLDNKTSILVSGVVKTVGTISPTCSIVTRTIGEVVKSGKSWRVVKPLEIEFR